MRRRPSASHLLIALAVVLAFVLNILALQQRSASVLVAVATTAIPSGTLLAPDLVELASVPSDFEGVGSLVTEDSLAGYEGWVVTRHIPEGGVLDVASLVSPGARQAMRSMSVPVEKAHAAGGAVTAGDRVDVITVTDGMAEYVVDDVEVVAVSVSEDGSFSVPGGYYVVVAVSAEDALSLAEAIDSESIEIVRSNGAGPVGGDD